MQGGFLTLGAYFVNLTIGTPGVNFTVLVDTGSSNTAVPSVDCQYTCGNASTNTLYNPAMSSSSKAIYCNSATCLNCNPDGGACVFGQPFCSQIRPNNCGFGVSYGGGSSGIYGSYEQDIICLGGSSGLCAMSSLGMISDSIYFGEQGILGLASDFNACNPSCVPTLMDDLLSQSQIQQNILGMCLTPTNGGVMDMGFIDSTRYQGNLTWIPQSMNRWYNFHILDVQVGSTSLGLPSFIYWTTNDVIGSFVDSGTSVILMGPAIWNTLTQVFQDNYCDLTGICGNNTLFDGNCFSSSQINPSDFPPVNFITMDQDQNQVTLSVTGQSYLLPVGDLYCLGMGQAVSLGIILGDVFLQEYYVAYDRQNTRLGFAPVANCEF
jgi:hypothetical protein